MEMLWKLAVFAEFQANRGICTKLERFQETSVPENWMKFWYFTQCNNSEVKTQFQNVVLQGTQNSGEFRAESNI